MKIFTRIFHAFFLKVQNLSKGFFRCIHKVKTLANAFWNVVIIVFSVFEYNINEHWFVKVFQSVHMSK